VLSGCLIRHAPSIRSPRRPPWSSCAWRHQRRSRIPTFVRARCPTVHVSLPRVRSTT